MKHRATSLSAAFHAACLAEIEALKPGNVHLLADGHGMVVQDFLASAQVAAEVIAQPDLTLGERIFVAVEATMSTVRCNTNLGIVLLCAPIIHADFHGTAGSLQENIRQVLSRTTVHDTALVFAAIKLAAPAGLGEAPLHNVNAAAQADLLTVMDAAKGHDLIAAQYSNAYADIFQFGLPVYQQALALDIRPAWAVTTLYLNYLATYPDTHIQRKFGEQTALIVRAEAQAQLAVFLTHPNPKTYQRELLHWDADLKARGINPGTSADMTVATVLCASLAN